MNKIDDLFVQTIALLDKQYALAVRHIDSGRSSLNIFEETVNLSTTNVSHIADVLNYAHGIIDHAVRFYKIASSIPRLSQKTPEFRKFHDGVFGLVDARNQIQHINRDADNNFTGPLLGSVSWQKSGTNFIAGFSDIGRTRSVPGLVFDTQERKFVMDFAYVFGDKYHDLGRAIESISSYHAFVLSRVEISFGEKKYDIEQTKMALAFKFS